MQGVADFEDAGASANIGPRHDHAAIESARSQKRGVEDIGTVRGGDENHAVIRLESIHFDEQLIERLLALVVTTA